MAWWLFQNVVITAALAAAVAMICRFSRLGPVARHALWVLVLVKFVTPPLVVWPWAAPDPLGVSRFDAQPSGTVVIAPPPVSILSNAAEAIPSLQLSEPDVVPVRSVSAAIAPDRSIGPIVWPWLLGIWITGGVALLLVETVRLFRLARTLARAEPADAAIIGRVRTLSVELGLRAVPVYQSAGVQSPFVACIGPPRLIWPARLDVNETCIDGLLVHELAHIKRGDHIVGWIELAAGVLWWWNPLFWFVRSALREQAELACDAWVISALPNGRRAYAESLLALSSLHSAPSPSSCTAAVVGVRASNRRVLERRLVMIMKGRAALRLPWAGLLTLVVMAAATLPAWATDAQQPAQAAITAQPAQAQKPKPQPTEVAVAIAEPVKQVPTTVSVRPVIVAQATKPQTVQGRPSVQVARPKVEHQTVIRPKVEHPTLLHQATTVPDRPQQTKFRAWTIAVSKLPEDGQNLVKSFEADRSSIQAEADAKVKARREATVKQLEALQEQYTKAGKLDEAIAIRDYLRSGGPSANEFFAWIKR
jgi:beta-lactamase regulating signal transducer with metallopeptidase domain